MPASGWDNLMNLKAYQPPLTDVVKMSNPGLLRKRLSECFELKPHSLLPTFAILNAITAQ